MYILALRNFHEVFIKWEVPCWAIHWNWYRDTFKKMQKKKKNTNTNTNKQTPAKLRWYFVAVSLLKVSLLAWQRVQHAIGTARKCSTGRRKFVYAVRVPFSKAKRVVTNVCSLAEEKKNKHWNSTFLSCLDKGVLKKYFAPGLSKLSCIIICYHVNSFTDGKLFDFIGYIWMGQGRPWSTHINAYATCTVLATVALALAFLFSILYVI